ncbi:MAG: hypothetical protein HKM91_11675 [Altererythrobacter sp.]|nr:hypothetical protein [Altererythrobacter sp.]
MIDLARPKGRSILTQFAKVAGSLFLCILITHYLHELGHALTAVALGYEVSMTSNVVRPIAGAYQSELHSNLISLAGPLVTIFIATAAFILRLKLKFLAPIILWNTLTMRLLAAIVSLRNPNDEAAVSANLGLGDWTLPAIVCVFLLTLFVITARQRRLSVWWYLSAWVGMSAGYSLVVLGEDWLPKLTL